MRAYSNPWRSARSPRSIFDKIYNTNVRGLLFGFQTALPFFAESASTILTGSIGATIGTPGMSVYGSPKAAPESNGEAREDLRSLIGEVVMAPGEKRGESHAVLRGEFMAILDLAAGRRRTPSPEVITKELAGRRFEPINRITLHS